MTCPECNAPVRDGLTHCPHCGRPSWFPNVSDACMAAEVTALDQRYDAAVQDAVVRGADGPRQALEKAACHSKTVCARYFGEVFRLAYSDDEVYATFYQRLEAGIRLPGGDRWERLRAAADTLLFGELQKRQVRFAALTLNGSGLTNYGDWLLFAREPMIAHRSTVFEENSVMFFRRHNVGAGNDYVIPLGYRAPWNMRHRLVVSKLVHALDAGTAITNFPAMLLYSGPDSEKDKFVEVHIWGPLTIRSFDHVSGRVCIAPPSANEQKVLEEKLAQVQVTLELP